MVFNPAYSSSETELDENINKNKRVNVNDLDEKEYSYDEALDLAGNGVYGISLLANLCLAILAMGVDMFGFSVIITGAKCDFKLEIHQTSILLSMSFIGPIIMAYPWGYISDTQGRKKSLFICLWASFLESSISAFSPNWIFLAVLKFISTSFCSGAQSSSYTLLGECSAPRVRDAYLLIIASVLDFCLAFYVGIAYLVLSLDFSYDFGFATFTPWRLLILILALPLGICALGMHFFYESPKFLLNAGKQDEALRRILKRNGGKHDTYPVKKIFLDEVGNERRTDIPFIQSLWEQILPLFKPPLLLRSIQLYILTGIVYGTNNSFYIWFPYLAEKFAADIGSSSDSVDQVQGICNVIVSSHNNSTNNVQCSPKMNISLVWASLAQSLVFVIILLGMTRMAHKKRMLMMLILLVSSVCGVAAVSIPDNVTSFIMFVGLLLNEMAVGLVFSYFVDLYPTSYRGMAGCLGVMVARSSALGGVNLIGAFIMSHCSVTFYACSAFMICGVLVSCLLPSDKPWKPIKY